MLTAPGCTTSAAGEKDSYPGHDVPDRQSYIYYANAPLWSCGVWADFVDDEAASGGFPVEWLHRNARVH